MLALYARLNNTTTSDAYWEIGEALCNDFHRERPNSGYEMAGNQQAGTGSPVSGTQTDLAGYERRGELKTVQQAVCWEVLCKEQTQEGGREEKDGTQVGTQAGGKKAFSGWADVAAGFWYGKGRLNRQRRKNAE